MIPTNKKQMVNRVIYESNDRQPGICTYCGREMTKTKDDEWQCPKRKWYTAGLHNKTSAHLWCYPGFWTTAKQYRHYLFRRILDAFD